MHGKRHWRVGFYALLGAGLLLPIIGTALHVLDENAQLVIDGLPIVAEGSRGSEIILEVPISNRGENTVRVLGAYNHCELSGCTTTPDLPMEIKAHESRKARVVYKVGLPDEPPFVLTFYTDCPSQPNLNATFINKHR